MSREIKFRAYSKTFKSMMMVDSINYDDDGNICSVETVDRYHTGSVEFFYETADSPNDSLLTQVALQQYTGLLDKNNKEIYEGDILRNRAGEIGQVVYLSAQFQFLRNLPKPYTQVAYSMFNPVYKLDTDTEVELNYEIIGNIYKDGGLLNG